MITVSVSHDGLPCVWNADDWLVLREEHRIVGELVGVLSNISNQNAFHGLPMMLLPEEATLLMERNIICLRKFPSLCRCPGEGVVKAYKSHCQKTFDEQAEQMREERKQAVMGLLDKIVEGRRRKLLGMDTKRKRKKVKTSDSAQKVESDAEEKEAKIVELMKPIDDNERETVLQEELAKIPPLKKENALTQTFTSYPWLRSEDACPVDWKYPSTPAEKTRYLAFKDLWEKGYYITAGHKFGGDFLVYPGDPVKFHSQFIVICVNHTEGIPVHQLISYGRIGSSVRKTFVLASLPQDSSEIVYQSITWTGSSSLSN